MEFEEVVRTRRSVRSYSDQALSDEAVERVLTLATRAPSANNVQPWRFIVVRDQAKREEIAEISFQQSFIAEAPVVIVCCGQEYHDSYSWIADNMYLVDVTIAIDHLTLAARDEGLGTCWIGAFDHDRLKAILNVPDGVDIVALTPLGCPASPSAFTDRTHRKSLSEVVFAEQYGA